MIVANKVMGMPERTFCEVWVATLWAAMGKTGRGYRRHSLRHTGKGDDRRKDKLGTTKIERQLIQQQTAPWKRTPRQIRRAHAAALAFAR